MPRPSSLPRTWCYQHKRSYRLPDICAECAWEREQAARRLADTERTPEQRKAMVREFEAIFGVDGEGVAS